MYLKLVELPEITFNISPYSMSVESCLWNCMEAQKTTSYLGICLQPALPRLSEIEPLYTNLTLTYWLIGWCLKLNHPYYCTKMLVTLLPLLPMSPIFLVLSNPGMDFINCFAPYDDFLHARVQTCLWNWPLGGVGMLGEGPRLKYDPHIDL